MLPKIFWPSAVDTFIVIDSIFPQSEPLAFRNTEINEYLSRISGAASYTMYPMKPGPDAWFSHGYGVSREVFEENKEGYLRFYPQNEAKIHYLEEKRRYKCQLAYSYFLGETYTLLPFYKRHNIPFMFVLYPGGAFGIDNEASDAMLRAICSSPQFKGVIVTQQVTNDYLIKNGLCPPDKIRYIYGGFVQFKRDDIRPRRYFKKDKKTLDICIVAAKYSDGGIDKGYDVFIEAAKRICAAVDDVYFHVIGGFDEHDIDVSDIKEHVRFYGYRRPDFLIDFYRDMDIFLSPNRPGKLFTGNFDGFPLGIDASYCGVALFVGDELRMNCNLYEPDKEIVIVPPHTEAVVEQVMKYYSHPRQLRTLADKGAERTRELFDVHYQIDERMKAFHELGGLLT